MAIFRTKKQTMAKMKEYTNGEVTITWEAHKCIHSELCVKGLSDVFKPDGRPWIQVEGATTEALVKQVKHCPSGALGFYMNAEKDQTAQTMETKVEVMENGPLLVGGTLS